MLFRSFGVAIVGLIAAWMVLGTFDERTCSTVLRTLRMDRGGGWISLHCLSLMLLSIGLVGALLCVGLLGAAWHLARTALAAADP